MSNARQQCEGTHHQNSSTIW